MSKFKITGEITGTSGVHKINLDVEELFEDVKVGKPEEVSIKDMLGEHLFEGSYVKGTLHVVYGMFENAVSITIYEMHGSTQKTLYTQNFFKQRDHALGTVEDVLAGKVDVEDLIFQLKEIKDKETN